MRVYFTGYYVMLQGTKSDKKVHKIWLNVGIFFFSISYQKGYKLSKENMKYWIHFSVRELSAMSESQLKGHWQLLLQCLNSLQAIP